MVNKIKSGIFRKYFTVSISIVLMCLVFSSTALLLLVSRVWLNEKLNLLTDNTNYLADNTANTLKSDLPESNRGAVAMICNSLRTISNAIGADSFIVNTKGEMIYCKEVLKSDMQFYTGRCTIHENYTVPKEVMDVLNSGESYSSAGNMGGVLSSTHLIVAVPLIIDGKVAGGVVSTQSVAAGLTPYVRTIFKMSFIAALVAFAVCFVIVYLVTYRLTEPLREMSYAAQKFALGDFSPVIKTKKKHHIFGYNEIDDLAEAFNAMSHSLASQEASRRSFVTNVSHELKTPMTSIGGFIDGILDGTIGPAEQDQYLIRVSDEIKRLSRLVTGMLNMSKIEEGELDIKPIRFDISEMIFRTLLNFEQKLESKKIDVQGLDSMEQNVVFADKDMINQVVYNLIDNAVKFTPDGGVISVSSLKDAEKSIIKVRNTGKGIAPDECEKVFERFYKVDKSRSYDVKGAGMGLFIVKTIIELHGGQITCRSVPDEYTEFIFNLPNEGT